MTQTYRTNDSGRWGTGKGSNLTPTEVDINFWDVIQRLVSLESADDGVTIDHFEVTGSVFYVHMSDSTILGPYLLPVATYRYMGPWQALTPYSVLDVFTINGSLYQVLFNHTSAATFDAGASDGMGHDYYGLLLSTPGNALPTGGATGQTLAKSTSADFAVTWIWRFPSGSGHTGQFLRQKTGTQDDVEWIHPDASEISFTPSTGSTLTASDVGAALNEIEAGIDSASTALSELTDVLFDTGSPVDGAVFFYNGVHWKSSASPSGGDFLKWDGSDWVPEALVVTDTLQFVIDGGGSSITTGLKGYLEVPYGCTITGVKLLADQSGSIVVDVWKTPYTTFSAAGGHPNSGDKITASAPPTISSTYKYKDTTLTGWTTSLSAEDIVGFNVNSVTSISRVTISLTVTRNLS